MAQPDVNSQPGTLDHSPTKTIFLSLAPGILILIFFVLLAPLAAKHSVPPMLVLFAAIAFILIPAELGFLLLQGKKLNGRFSLEQVILFRERIPLWQLALLVVLTLSWCIASFMIVSPRVDPFIIRNYFSWLPQWFFANQAGRSHNWLFWLTVVAGFIFNGIAGPIVEELYFRGYLLPRMRYAGAWAPLLNAILFSLYHFFSPWQNVVRIIALVPFIYVVWWKRNIYIGMITHCTLNLLGMIFALAAGAV